MSANISRGFFIFLMSISLSLFEPSQVVAGTAGPDAFGYTSIDSLEAGGPTFEFNDISSTGTQVTFFDADALPTQNANADDGVAINLALTNLNEGFGFPFYGEFKTSVNMGTNGFLHFDLDGTSDSLSNNCPIANAVKPNNIIAVLWDDLVLRNPPSALAGGFIQQFNPCPNTKGGTWNCVIFQWNNADHFGGGVNSFDFQVILYDNGNILMNFPGEPAPLDNPEHGTGSTTGLENGDASIGITHVCDTANSIPDNYSILFRPPLSALPVVYESETNDTSATANTLAAGFCGAGNIRSDGDADFWASPGNTTGQLIYAMLDSQGAAPSSDTFLRVFANDGSTIIADDDSSGLGAGSAIVGTIPQDGKIFSRVSEFGDDITLSLYRLIALVMPASDVAAEAENNDTRGTANPVTAGQMSGTFSSGADVDFFSFQATSGDGIAAIANNDPDNNSTFTDSLVEIFDPNGTSLGSSDIQTVFKATAVGNFVAPLSGTYTAKMSRGAGTADDDYRVAISVNCESFCADEDGDLACNTFDNCLGLANADQQDKDEDLTGDSCDACPDDSAKASAGICGCGTADVDTDDNDILDCKFGSELGFRLDALKKAVKALKRSSSANKIKAAKAALTKVKTYVTANGSSITLTGNGDIDKLTSKISKTVNAATKVLISAFDANKKAALKAIKSLDDKLAAD